MWGRNNSNLLCTYTHLPTYKVYLHFYLSIYFCLKNEREKSNFSPTLLSKICHRRLLFLFCPILPWNRPRPAGDQKNFRCRFETKRLTDLVGFLSTKSVDRCFWGTWILISGPVLVREILWCGSDIQLSDRYWLTGREMSVALANLPISILSISVVMTLSSWQVRRASNEKGFCSGLGKPTGYFSISLIERERKNRGYWRVEGNRMMSEW